MRARGQAGKPGRARHTGGRRKQRRILSDQIWLARRQGSPLRARARPHCGEAGPPAVRARPRGTERPAGRPDQLEAHQKRAAGAHFEIQPADPSCAACAPKGRTGASAAGAGPSGAGQARGAPGFGAPAQSGDGSRSDARPAGGGAAGARPFGALGRGHALGGPRRPPKSPAGPCRRLAPVRRPRPPAGGIGPARGPDGSFGPARATTRPARGPPGAAVRRRIGAAWRPAPCGACGPSPQAPAPAARRGRARGPPGRGGGP